MGTYCPFFWGSREVWGQCRIPCLWVKEFSSGNLALVKKSGHFCWLPGLELSLSNVDGWRHLECKLFRWGSVWQMVSRGWYPRPAPKSDRYSDLFHRWPPFCFFPSSSITCTIHIRTSSISACVKVKGFCTAMWHKNTTIVGIVLAWHERIRWRARVCTPVCDSYVIWISVWCILPLKPLKQSIRFCWVITPTELYHEMRLSSRSMPARTQCFCSTLTGMSIVER